MLFYYSAWKAFPEYSRQIETKNLKISIVIAARNEEKNIGKLLQALQTQTYQKEYFEIIIVDDHSTDRTAEIIYKYGLANLRVIRLQEDQLNSYKKKAIETGIHSATGELIVTTDADCIPTNEWLKTLAGFYYEKKPVFIAAPVTLAIDSTILQIFQGLDFISLQGITAASVYKKYHSMCNGANLAYPRKIFFEVSGFDGIDNIASGDDMLLMHKIAKKYPQDVYYLKNRDAIITTKPMESWKDFLNQRIRWASKATYYQDRKIFWVLLLVYLFNLSFLLLLIAGFWNYYFWISMTILWGAKTIVEIPLVYSVASFFSQKSLLKYFFFFQPLHIFYTIIAGWLGQFVSYEWKGRKVK
jgi:poly-beta-1,6-N-acetyl-D-glucosamine synthase